MTVVRAGTDVEVKIDGNVQYKLGKLKKSWIIEEVEVKEVTDIDAYYDDGEETGNVTLSNEEMAQAEQLITEKFKEGV